jgi:riboflavin synthase
MFTGIIRYTGEIAFIKSISQGKRIQIKADIEFISKLEKGISSIAIDGACHTIEEKEKSSFTVFSSFETLDKTTIGTMRPGNRVNLELSLNLMTLLDGHIVQGHVDGVGRIRTIQKKGEAFHLTINAEDSITRYMVEKDSVAVDGISLTMFGVDASSFQVSVIPETARQTCLLLKHAGEKVNIEINIFAKYASKFLGHH